MEREASNGLVVADLKHFEEEHKSGEAAADLLAKLADGAGDKAFWILTSAAAYLRDSVDRHSGRNRRADGEPSTVAVFLGPVFGGSRPNA